MNRPLKTTLALLLLAPLAAAAAEPALIPVEYFTQTSDYSLASLSPDGKHLAVSVRKERDGLSLPTLTVYAVPQMTQVSTVAMPVFETPTNVWWLGNNRLAVTKGALYKNPSGWSTTAPEVTATNLDGTQPQYLFGPQGASQEGRTRFYGDDAGSVYLARVPTLRDGHVTVGSSFWNSDRSVLYDIDSITAARTLLADIPAKPLVFTLQQDGKPRFAWGTKDDKALLYRRDDAGASWNQVQLDATVSRYRALGFTPDDQAVYVSYAQGGAPLSLVREDMATGVRTTIASDPLGDIDKFEFTRARLAPFAYLSNAGRPQARYLDDKAPEAALHKLLSAAFPSAYVEFLSFSDDGQRLLFRARSDRNPGAYYLFDQKSGKSAFLFSHMERIDPARMAESRPITFSARDGLTLTGYLTLPARQGKARLPLVLLPHTGPAVSNDWFFDADAQFLASRGYAVLQVNFRGSSGRGAQFEAAGHRQFGLKIMDDLVDSVTWASALPEIDGKRVCVVGEGFGAYAALMLPARARGMFACAAGRSGYYDLANRYTRTGTADPKPAKIVYNKAMGDDPVLLRQQSPVTLAKDITLPVLLVKGIRDDVFLPKQAEAMRDALAREGRAPEWFEEQQLGHPDYDPKRQQAYFERLEAFLARHLAK